MLAAIGLLTFSHVAGFAVAAWLLLRSDHAALPPESDGPPPPGGSAYRPRWPVAPWSAKAARDRHPVG